MSLYLLLALIYYQLRVNKRTTKRFLELSLEERYCASLKYACIIIAIASALHQSCFFGYLILPTLAGKEVLLLQENTLIIICNVFPKLSDAALCFGSCFIVLYFWFRQRIFYVHSSLAMMDFTHGKRLGLAILIVYGFFLVFQLIAYLITVQYRYHAGSCLVRENSADYITILNSTWTVISVLMHITLLGLFVYPIRQLSLWKEQQSEKIRCLQKTAKKAAVFALICFLSDALPVLLVSLTSLYEENATVPTFLNSTNLIINQLATIFYFDHWKKLLWPWSAAVLCEALHNDKQPT